MLSIYCANIPSEVIVEIRKEVMTIEFFYFNSILQCFQVNRYKYQFNYTQKFNLKGFLHRKLTFDMLLSITKYEKMRIVPQGVKMFQTKVIDILSFDFD